MVDLITWYSTTYWCAYKSIIYDFSDIFTMGFVPGGPLRMTLGHISETICHKSLRPQGGVICLTNFYQKYFYFIY